MDAAIRVLDRRPTGESVGDGLETGSEPEAKSREVPWLKGEAPGNRTRNHRLKRPMLCQLS